MISLIKRASILLGFLLLAGAAFAADVNNPPTPPPLNASMADLGGDSRMTDAFTITSSGRQFGYQQLNWFIVANALSGNRWQPNLNVAASGCRTDQFMGLGNLLPAINSQAGWFVLGYPIINNMGAQTGNSTPSSNSCSNSPATFPYTDNNGNVITLSNLATFAIADITNGIKPFLARGKKVILTAEVGNPSTANTAATVATGTASITTTVFTVSACTSCFFYPAQTLQTSGGSPITGGTRILAQLTGTGGATCPDPTCNGGIGTYSVNISQTVTSETINGQYTLMALMREFNAREEALAQAYPGQVYFWSAASCLYNPTGSATAVSFRTNVLLDNLTHFNNLGGYYGALCFNSTGIQNNVPAPDVLLSSINDVNAANPRELINNPLFNTTTGGTVNTCTVSGGNATPPSGYTVICGQASTTITMTTPADPSTPSYGNDFTIAVTTTGADLVRIQSNSPSNNTWNLTDWIQTASLISVAAGSSHLSV
jgi:hypothetical protein